MNVIIVESENEYEDFIDIWENEDSLIIPIFKDIYKHPSNKNPLSFLFIKTRTKIFILPYDHTDCINFTGDLTRSQRNKYVLDKKGFLQTGLSINNIYDLNTYLFFNEKKNPIVNFDDFSILRHYKRFGIEDKLGMSIPILKWVEYLNMITDEVDINSFPRDRSWIDTEMIPILSKVENIGLRVDVDKYKKTKYSSKHLNGDILYTKYNPYTMTSRPSNTYGGINFSALPKDTGIRKMFIPREDNVFIQFDYDAYHVRIIGRMIDYDLPSSSVHQWLADLYGVDYSESKKITFRILYSGNVGEYRDIEFFEEVEKFIQSLETKDQVSTLKKRVIRKTDMENPTSAKLFNYLLQAMETEFNMSVMNLLDERDLPLPILYTYDSFLFDIPRDKKLVQDIKDTLEYFEFPVKMSGGLNYSEV